MNRIIKPNLTLTLQISKVQFVFNNHLPNCVILEPNVIRVEKEENIASVCI